MTMNDGAKSITEVYSLHKYS